jgi:tetratricopeptide (TPR) repeat protein
MMCMKQALSVSKEKQAEESAEDAFGIGEVRCSHAFIRHHPLTKEPFVAGQMEQAIDHYARAIELCETRNQPTALCRYLTNSGLAHYQLSAYPQSLQHFDRALEIALSMNNRKLEATLLSNIGLSYYGLSPEEGAGNSTPREMAGSLRVLEDALDAFEQSYRLFAELDDAKGQQSQLMNLGMTSRKRGELETAADYFEQALAHDESESSGDRRDVQIFAVLQLGKIYADLGLGAKAAEFKSLHIQMTAPAMDKKAILGKLGAMRQQQ